jgi:hypothetical protein
MNWEIHEPRGCITDLVNDVRQMRARVFYAGGRPGFLHNGRYSDPCQLDAVACHLVGRTEAGPVGCIRLVSLADVRPCVTEKLVGPDCLDQALARLNIERNGVAEISRWAVAERYQRTSLGVGGLAAGVIALARMMGLTTLIGAAATRGNGRKSPAEMWTQIGFRWLGIDSRWEEAYQDLIQFGYLELDKVVPEFEPAIRKMALIIAAQLERGSSVRPDPLPLRQSEPMVYSAVAASI